MKISLCLYKVKNTLADLRTSVSLCLTAGTISLLSVSWGRGFTTLSATLGKLALSLHDGLLQAAASEADPAALTAVLRSLHVLICSAPYARLPPTLLSRTLSVRCLYPPWNSSAALPTIDDFPRQEAT
jgi:hypothetical protein